MSDNKTILSNHNARLESLVEQVDALPDANVSVFETWVFELENGTTIEKRVEVSA